MANTYSDATGVLILDRVTPVISALFGAFRLDASYPGNGRAYIARLAEINDPQWSDVLDGLLTLAAQLDLPAPDDAEGEDGEDRDAELSMPALIDLIAPHFGADQNQDLANLIEHHPFEGSADLDALFLIATCFDDGHPGRHPARRMLALQPPTAFRVRRAWLLHQPRADGIERIHACAATRRGTAHRNPGRRPCGGGQPNCQRNAGATGGHHRRPGSRTPAQNRR